MLTRLDANRSQLRQALFERRPLDPAAATYLAWLDCRALGLGDDPAAAFLARGRVALSRGLDYGRGRGTCPPELRDDAGAARRDGRADGPRRRAFEVIATDKPGAAKLLAEARAGDVRVRGVAGRDRPRSAPSSATASGCSRTSRTARPRRPPLAQLSGHGRAVRAGSVAVGLRRRLGRADRERHADADPRPPPRPRAPGPTARHDGVPAPRAALRRAARRLRRRHRNGARGRVPRQRAVPDRVHVQGAGGGSDAARVRARRARREGADHRPGRTRSRP